MIKHRLIYFMMIVLSFQACIGDERGVPSTFIQPEEMKKILYECYVADAYNAERIYRDHTLHLQKENVTYYKKILDNYGVNQQKFFASMEYYTSHPKAFSELADSLNNYAKRMGEIKVNLPENSNNGHHLRDIRKSIGNP